MTTETVRRFDVGDRVSVEAFRDGCLVCGAPIASTIGTVIEHGIYDAHIVTLDVADGVEFDSGQHVCGARLICNTEELQPVDGGPCPLCEVLDQHASHYAHADWRGTATDAEVDQVLRLFAEHAAAEREYDDIRKRHNDVHERATAIAKPLLDRATAAALEAERSAHRARLVELVGEPADLTPQGAARLLSAARERVVEAERDHAAIQKYAVAAGLVPDPWADCPF